MQVNLFFLHYNFTHIVKEVSKPKEISSCGIIVDLLSIDF